MPTCLFCRIINKEIPANIVYTDEDIIAFDDIHPKTPYHKLIIPRKHIATLNDITQTDIHLAGKLLYVAQQLAKAGKIAAPGYRVVMNCNPAGGQEVYHIHLHMLGGRRLGALPD